MAAESADPNGAMKLPIYPDGYPGLMFQRSIHGFYLLPKKKKLSELFLYGQTVQRITMTVEGCYRFIIFQLYPFASRFLLNVEPKALKDDCFDLLQLQSFEISECFVRLKEADKPGEQIELMSDIVEALVAVHHVREEDRIQKAVGYIIQSSGQIKISEVRERVSLTERTLERNFLNQVGLTPKQFAGIIQFQSSLGKMDNTGAKKLTDIAFESGFADQSHFVRVFRMYTGLAPSQYLRQSSAYN